MNGKILICLSVVLAVQLANVHGANVCEWIVSSSESFTCPDGSDARSPADAKACARTDDDGVIEDVKCLVTSTKNGCPKGWPYTMNKSCYRCCCDCHDPKLSYFACCVGDGR